MLVPWVHSSIVPWKKLHAIICAWNHGITNTLMAISAQWTAKSSGYQMLLCCTNVPLWLLQFKRSANKCTFTSVMYNHVGVNCLTHYSSFHSRSNWFVLYSSNLRWRKVRNFRCGLYSIDDSHNSSAFSPESLPGASPDVYINPVTCSCVVLSARLRWVDKLVALMTLVFVVWCRRHRLHALIARRC